MGENSFIFFGAISMTAFCLMIVVLIVGHRKHHDCRAQGIYGVRYAKLKSKSYYNHQYYAPRHHKADSLGYVHMATGHDYSLFKKQWEHLHGARA